MTTSPNIYTILLLYSILSGASLRALHDTLEIFKNQFIPSCFKEQNNTEPIPLTHTSTLRSLLRNFSPAEKRPYTVVTAVTDILFALICALTVTLLLFGLNFGEMRWFVIPIMAAGYCLYGETLGRVIRLILTVILSRAIWLITAVLRLILRPLVKFTRFSCRKVRGMLNRLRKCHPTTTTELQTSSKRSRKSPKNACLQPKERKNKKNQTFFQKPLDKPQKM